MPEDPASLIKDGLARRRKADVESARRAFADALSAAQGIGQQAEALAAGAHLAVLDRDQAAASAALARLVQVDPVSSYANALGMILTETWPPEPRPCTTHLVARAKGFRDLCDRLPRRDEAALELGASCGRATERLARVCREVYAVEQSADMANRARSATEGLSNVRVLTLSADDPGLVLAHVPRADLVYLDIGGSTPPAKVMETARLYRELYQPRCLVIRCVKLNNFVAELASFEPVYGASVWGPGRGEGD